jgi:hypothetical protein
MEREGQASVPPACVRKSAVLSLCRQVPAICGESVLGRNASDASNLQGRWRDGRAIAVAVPVVVAGVRALHTPEEPERASMSGRTTNRRLLRTGPAQDA